MRIVLAFILVTSVAVVSCGGTETPNSEAKTAAKTPKNKDATKPFSKKKGWGGWRWKGERNDCFFLHGNKCFDSFEKACNVAKCPAANCVHDESAPAKVSCKKG